MLIQSNFRDYYDVGTKYGIDTQVRYRRVSQTIPAKGPHLNASELLVRRRRIEYTFKIKPFIVGFCGVLVPCIEMVVGYRDGTGTPSTLYFYDLPTLQAFLTEWKVKQETSFSRWRSRYYGERFDIQDTACTTKFFDVLTWQELTPNFATHRTPIFVYEADPEAARDKHILTINARLAEYAFVKHKDPITAFQEVYRYVSGVLPAAEESMVKISDKEKARKHGHDGKYSFRRPPSDGKKKRPRSK